MKIAYVTHYDPRNVKSWSGAPYHLIQGLEHHGVEVEAIGPLDAGWVSMLRLKNRFYTDIARKKYMAYVDPLFLRPIGRKAKLKLAKSSPDFVLATHVNHLAYLDTRHPVVLWVDCTFGGMVDFYPDYVGLCAESLRDGHRMDKRALDRANLAIFTSEWAARSAVELYGFDARKSAVVPFGANIDCQRTAQGIEHFLAARPPTQCNLLFIGRIWDRKGGDMAMAVAQRLHDAGMPVKLTLLGSAPPDGRTLPDFVCPLGFISKATDEGKQRIDCLLAESHFLIVPSRAEAYGIVFCEASSFGVPSLTTNVGGIPTVVRDGRNGHAFPLDAAPEDYCQYVLDLMANYAAYQSLARSSFNEYLTRLNWGTATASVIKLLEKM